MIKNLYQDYTKNSYNSIIRKQTTNRLNSYFTRDNLPMVNKYIKCSPLSVIREMEMKITMKYHLHTHWKGLTKKTSIGKDKEKVNAHTLLLGM